MNWLKSENFRIGILEKSCGLYLYPQDTRYCLIFSLNRTTECDGQNVKNDVDDLINVATKILHDRSSECHHGSWKIVADSRREVFFIEFRGVRLFMTAKDLDEFLELVSRLSITGSTLKET